MPSDPTTVPTASFRETAPLTRDAYGHSLAIEVMHPDGQQGAHVSLYREDGYHGPHEWSISDIEPIDHTLSIDGGVYSRNFANRLGPSVMRQTARHLRDTYGIQSVRGTRITGARNPDHGDHEHEMDEGVRVSRPLTKALPEAGHDDLGLPPQPGTAPIPEGHVRLFHQTQAAHLEGIRAEGIHIRHARGVEGPQAIYADEKGFYGKPGDVPTVEFHVPKEQWSQPFVRTPHVTPNQIVAIHEPWHHTARYIHAKVLDQALAGAFDHLKDRPGTDKSALEHLQSRYGKPALAKSQATPRALEVYPHVRPFTPEELENEVGEYFHNPETQKALPKAFASPDILRTKIQEAPLRVLSHAQLSSLQNTDAGDVLSHANPMHRVRELGREYGRDPKRIFDGMQQQVKLPTPIVIHHDHGMHLLGGNTRLMTMAAARQTMPVRMIDIRSEGASPALAKGFERNDDYRPPRSLRLVSKPVKTDTALGGRLEITAHSYDIFDSHAEHADHPIGQVSVRKQTRVSDGQVSHTARINGDNQRDHGLGVQGLKSVATMIAKMHPELREFAISRRKAGIRQAVNATERVPYLPGMTSEMRTERAAGNSKAVLQTAREAEEAVAARGISPYQQKTHRNPWAKSLHIEQSLYEPHKHLRLEVHRADNPDTAVQVELYREDKYHKPGHWEVNIDPLYRTDTPLEHQNAFGAAHIRELARHLKGKYGVQGLEGGRSSGARVQSGKPDRRASVSLDRMSLPDSSEPSYYFHLEHDKQYGGGHRHEKRFRLVDNLRHHRAEVSLSRESHHPAGQWTVDTITPIQHAVPNDYDTSHANTFGPTAMRTFARHLRNEHGVTSLVGSRVTGARRQADKPDRSKTIGLTKSVDGHDPIVAPAIRLHTGQVITAPRHPVDDPRHDPTPIHGDAAVHALQIGHNKNHVTAALLRPSGTGFVTRSGKFITRRDAIPHALAHDQVEASPTHIDRLRHQYANGKEDVSLDSGDLVFKALLAKIRRGQLQKSLEGEAPVRPRIVLGRRTAAPLTPEWHTEDTREHPMNPRKRVVTRDGAMGTYEVSEDPMREKHVRVSEIQAVTRGGGRAAMEHLTERADRHGVTLSLSADPLKPTGEGKQLSPRALKSWYKTHGFASPPGSKMGMVRRPER